MVHGEGNLGRGPGSRGTLAAGAVLAGDAREVRKTLPLDADGTLSVETYKGSVTVTAGNGAEA